MYASRKIALHLFATAMILLMAAAELFAAQATQNGSSAKNMYDHGLRHFYWNYSYDPEGHRRRDWYQESSSAWNEIYEDGRYNHSRIVDTHAVVDGNSGIICVADTSTLRLFIPDRGATGSSPEWLRIQQQGAAGWTIFARKVEVDSPIQPLAVAASPVKDDLSELQQLATTGNVSAQALLGYRFYSGTGVAQNYLQAAYWFRKAANQGNAESQYFLGLMNQRGDGSAAKQDYAHTWFEMAARQGYEPAKDALAKMDDRQVQVPTQQPLQREQIVQRTVEQTPSLRQGLAVQPVATLSNSALSTSSAKNMDADGADIAALLKRIASAHSEKVPQLQGNSPWLKSCRSGKPNNTQDAAETCVMISLTIQDESWEPILLKGCSYPPGSTKGRYRPCVALAQRYFKANRNIEALAALSLPNADAASDSYAVRLRLDLYKAIGNDAMVNVQLHTLCYDLDQAHYCRQLQAAGENVDMADAVQRQHERNVQRNADAAQRQADELRDRQQSAANREAIYAAITGAADNVAASMQQSQADMAQARVNAAAIRMAQQNKGAGGYPTTSSGSASSSNSSSTSSPKPSVKKSTATSSDSSDATNSDSTDTTNADANPSSADPSASVHFNGYRPTAGGYSPTSASATGSSSQAGHWAEIEINVGYASVFVPHSNITAVLTDEQGSISQYGGYVSFANTDAHPFFYGFAGVINERFEANTSKLIRWPAPYLATNRVNPPFEARIAIRYWALY